MCWACYVMTCDKKFFTRLFLMMKKHHVEHMALKADLGDVSLDSKRCYEEAISEAEDRVERLLKRGDSRHDSGDVKDGLYASYFIPPKL